MTDYDAMFDKIVEECPIDPISHTCEWVEWIRDEGYALRMHGDILHHKIIKKLISFKDEQNKEPVDPSTEKYVAAATQLKLTSDALKAKEVDGISEADIADMYEDIDLCLDNIGKMEEGI